MAEQIFEDGLLVNVIFKQKYLNFVLSFSNLKYCCFRISNVFVFLQIDMWLFTDETKARYGQQKKNGFVEALLEIESNPETVYENRYRNDNRNDS
jgi:hypothetical protein